MKTYVFKTRVVAIPRNEAIVTNTVKGTSRPRSHKLEVVINPQMRKAIEEVAALPENANGIKPSFGVINGSGNLVISLQAPIGKTSAAQKLAEVAGCELVCLPALAKGAEITITYVLRYGAEDFKSYGVKAHDTFVNPRTQEEGDVDQTHIAPQGFELSLNPTEAQFRMAELALTAEMKAKAFHGVTQTTQTANTPNINLTDTEADEISDEVAEEDTRTTKVPARSRRAADTKVK